MTHLNKIMNEQNWLKLWVIKFCLKVIYPKFNLNTFLVFLAIKYRCSHRKVTMAQNDTASIEIITIPSQYQQVLSKDYVENKLDVIMHKCLIISREFYVQLAAENLFYIDNGVLWLTLKLTPSTVHKYKKKRKFIATDKSSKYNFNVMTTEIHKKLWTDNSNSSIDNIRIVPVVGSKLVENNIGLTSENEYHNIISSFGLNDCKTVQFSFHPLSFEYAPKIAVSAEVNLIVNDYDLSNDFIKEILNNYFEAPKLLSPSDVFSIDLCSTVTTKYHYKYLDLIAAAGKLFFKCNKFTSTEAVPKEKLKDLNKIQQAYFVVKGVTQLSLGENIHSLKPKDEYLKFNNIVSGNINLSLCPAGLKDKFDDIQDTIRLFVTGEINALSSSLSNPIVPMLLITGSVGSGRHLLIKCLAKYNGMNCLQVDCSAIQSSTAKQTESKINSAIQKTKAAAPVIVVLDNFEMFAVDPENNEDCRIMEYFTNTITDLYQNYTKHPIIFIAVCEKLDLKPNILRVFLEKFNIPRLSVLQRYEILHWFVSAMNLCIDGENEKACELSKNVPVINQDNLSINSKDVLHRIAAKTETFLYGDMDTLVHFAMRESYLKQLKSIDPLPSDPNLLLIQEKDFETALESIRSLQSEHLDAPKIPKVYWEDIGGLEKLKKELLKTIEFPIKYSHLFKNSSLKRSGILLYGPPGCGKTLVAKAVSTELNVSFLSVKGPELLNMYIGQSEENVRRVFESARASSPCIVFLDELDALAPRRGAAGDSGGASDRVVSQLLAEVDGVASGEDADTQSFVFIMGATNRPDLLEQSLLRPGRLDKLIYVGPYKGVEEKTCVLKALCRSYKMRQEVNLEQVAAALPDRCTGADLLQVVSTARSAAVRALVAKLHAGTTKESELSTDSVVLGVSELWQGVESFRPSVTDEELAYYESLQAQM